MYDIQITNGHTDPVALSGLSLVELERETARLRKRMAWLEKENAYLQALASDALTQNSALVADLKLARHMAGLWKRAARDHWQFKQLVNEYMQSLKAEG